MNINIPEIDKMYLWNSIQKINNIFVILRIIHLIIVYNYHKKIK